MPSTLLFTYADAVEHGLGLLGSQANTETARDVRRAVQSAYREFAASKRWSYFISRGRITTVASYSTGTITYTNSTRTLTLASGTWPSWAALGVVVIDSVPYEVASRTSDTVVILSVNSNPGADVAAGTTYSLYRDKYPLPIDFIAADQFIGIGTSVAYPQYVLPSEWLAPQQLNVTPGTPRRYTFMGDPNYLNTLSVFFQPPPDAAIPFEFIYQRRPRQIITEEYKVGTVSVSANSDSVTGSGTAWSSRHIGSVLRISATAAADYPTSIIGANPYFYERVVIDVASATSLTVDTAIPEAASGVKYVLSDPIDLEDGAMLTAFQRCIEKQSSIVRHMKGKMDFEAAYQRAWIAAAEADSRNFATRIAGAHLGTRVRMTDYPRGDDA